MLTINLISQHLKSEVKLRHVYSFIKRVNYIIIFLIFIASASLYAGKHFLIENFNRITDENAVIAKTGQGYNDKVRGINSKIRSVGLIQDDYMPWSHLLKNLAEKSAAGVTFSSLQIDKQNQSVRINGHAPYRSGLLGFKEALEADAIFRDIEFPLKNILEKEDINFEIRAKFDINQLKTVYGF